MRRAAILALACAAIAPLAACTDDDTDSHRPTRVICTEAGRTTHDDFAKPGDDIQVDHGFIEYASDTQHGTVRVSGTCATYPMARPAGWTPVVAGIATAR